MKYYLLTWSMLGNARSFVDLYGPFESEDACTKAGELWQFKHDDNPCWQVLTGRPMIRLGEPKDL